MSILTDYMDKFVTVDETTEPDGRGGVRIVYKEGAEFDAAVSKDSTTNARIAEKEGFTAIYTILTSRTVALSDGKIIKRKEDGLYFKIKGDGVDGDTPSSAGLDLREYEAERWEKPKNG